MKHENDSLTVVIETPRNSRIKYKYDPESTMFECAFFLPLGMSLPFDFGFVPDTLADDGDPIDILVLMDEPGFPGCIAKVRLIGVLEANQTERDGKTNRNDRLLAVHKQSLLYEEIKTYRDLDQGLRGQIEHFFVAYNDGRGKKFEVLGWKGIEISEKLLRKSMRKREKDAA